MTLSRRLVAWPFRHFGLKLLSLALALLLWMVVAGEEIVERGLRVPLELQQMPSGVEVLGDIPTTVDVRVRGGSGTLSRVGLGTFVDPLLDQAQFLRSGLSFGNHNAGFGMIERQLRNLEPRAEV